MKKTIALAAVAALAGTAMGTDLVIDVSGVESWDFQGDADNTILNVFVGAGATITNIAWNVNLTTLGISWADENTMTFNGAQSINVAAGDAFTVSNANYAGSAASGIVLDGSGMLSIEFHEVGFDDNANAVDSFFNSGSLTISYVPAPSALAVLGLGGLAAGRRRR
ncbi:MAG: PEP-CTERM sorting domain-containing protein [Phycisphaerales bacterium]|nr:PEP-CTERM sorting domain-containing protein [Phycisphaerales bacterium]